MARPPQVRFYRRLVDVGVSRKGNYEAEVPTWEGVVAPQTDIRAKNPEYRRCFRSGPDRKCQRAGDDPRLKNDVYKHASIVLW